MGVHLQAELEQGLVVKTRLCSQFFFFLRFGFYTVFFSVYFLFFVIWSRVVFVLYGADWGFGWGELRRLFSLFFGGQVYV
jgi:hypothetical protein